MKLRLYHGTAYGFDAFDGRFTLRGSEPNSGLGIHLTEYPGTAAAYAELAARDVHGERPRVLVLDVDIGKAALVDSAEAFLGRGVDDAFDFDGNRTREEFVEARLRLQSEGFHAVAVDSPIEDICGAWCVFDPSRIEIVGEMSVDEAQELDADGAEWDGVEMVPVPLFEEWGEDSRIEDDVVSAP